MKQRKALEIMWVNVKVLEKIREKAVMEVVNTFKPKTILHLPTVLLLLPRQVHSLAQLTTPQKVATQTFDDDQTPPISRIHLTKTNV